VAFGNSSSGTLNIGSSGGSDTAGTIVSPSISFGSGTGTLNFNQSDTATLTSSISGNGSVNQLGSGTTILSGNNSFGGTSTISAGSLEAASTNALGSSSVKLTGGTLSLSTNLTLSSLVWNSSATVALPNLNQGDCLTVTGLLTLTGGGTNTFNLSGDTLGSTPLDLLSWGSPGSITTNSFAAIGTGNYLLSISNSDTLWIQKAVLNFSWNAGSKGTWDTNSTNWLSGTNTSKVAYLAGANALFTNAAAVTLTNVGISAGNVTASNNTGTTSFSGGNLRASSLTLSGAGALVVNDSLLISTSIAVTTNGTLSLLNTNIASGVSISGGGKVILGNNLSLGVGTLSFDDGILSPNKTATALGNAMEIGTGGAVITNAASLTLSGPISGSGELTKTGAGSLSLAGPSSYLGGTLVSQGTLVGNAKSLQGDITNKGTLVFNQIGSGTFSGDISGTGGVKVGTLYSGSLILSGTNTYTGGTLVAAGLSGDLTGTTESLQGKITNNGAVAFAQAGSGTYSGPMSGTGALIIGEGTITLSGTNSYKGGTTVVPGGQLVGNITGIQRNITNDAVVTFDQATTGTYAGAMSGTGLLTKTGAGTLTLSGNNTYSGGTLISAGGLIGTTLNIQGNITNDASLTFNQTKPGTYGGNLSGTGLLNKSGSSTLTLSGENTSTGGTLVSAGTLSGTTTSLEGSITNNATVVFNQSGSGSFTGSISGKGKLSDTGSGSVTLAGINSYTGGTRVTLGNLAASSLGTGALVIKPSKGADASFTDTLGSGTLSLGAMTLSGSSTVAIATPYASISSGKASVTISGTNNFIDLSGAWTNLGTYSLVSGKSIAGSGLKAIDLSGSFLDGAALALGESTNYDGYEYTFTNSKTALELEVSDAFMKADTSFIQVQPSGALDVEAVPEPSDFALLGLGFGALLVIVRRRPVSRGSR
jgi:autotransporter-associated beta strand protein